MLRRVLWIALGIAMMTASENLAEAGNTAVWFGTRGSSRGIYRAVLDLESGNLSNAELAAEIKNPGFLCINAAGDRLYSLGSMVGTEDNVAVFEIGADGTTLTPMGSANSGCGKPTHLSLSKDEKTLLLAHYGGGAVASMPLDESGKILPAASKIDHTGSSVNKQRQDKPHPHWIGATPDNKFVLVPDLGTDEVVIYHLDTKNHTLTPHGAGKVPAGSGPRHLKFHPNAKWAYVLNELSLTVTGFHYGAAKGSLDPFQTVVALPQSELKDILTSGSEIRMHPSGKFVYAGIRGHDVIAVFAIDQESGALTLVEREPIRGAWPRNFGIDPTGKWLLAAGAESSTVSVFRIDAENGRLTFTRQVISVPQSICVEFQPLAGS